MSLVDVRCPFTNVDKGTGKKHPCNRTCVKVNAGSSGEAWCRFCRKSFNFQIQNDDSNDEMVYPFKEPE